MFGVVDDTILAAARPALATLGVFLVCAAMWPKPVATGRAAMVAGSFAMMAQYAWWRITETLPASAFSFEYGLALVFLSRARRHPYRRAFPYFPHPDARSIARCGRERGLASLTGEPAFSRCAHLLLQRRERAILERTIVGALGMDYPNFRVWMLDDGRRDWVKTLCAELGCRYLSRSDNAHAKAGNINHALEHIAAIARSSRVRFHPRRGLRPDAASS